MSGFRIVLCASFASYSEGGGHQSVFLQYLLGLKALGHDVFWFDLLDSQNDLKSEIRLVKHFFHLLEEYGLEDRAAVLCCDEGPDMVDLAAARIYGMTEGRIKEIAKSAELLWNFCGSLRHPLLGLFRRRVLIDLDPGLLQGCAAEWDPGINDHDAFLTVGKNLQASDCGVPTLGVTWRGFHPFVYLPMWEPLRESIHHVAFTSVTEWTWHTVEVGGRLISASKRDAYLRYIDFPKRAGRSFELAADIHPLDETGDRELLLANGWKLVHPHEVAHSPSSYKHYIESSYAEFACCKPIYRDLKTGWFSDRSACYLACAKPVLAEETGFSKYLPTGQGLVKFNDMEEALAGVVEIDSNYEHHSRAAREIAEAFLNSQQCLDYMLCASG